MGVIAVSGDGVWVACGGEEGEGYSDPAVPPDVPPPSFSGNAQVCKGIPYKNYMFVFL